MKKVIIIKYPHERSHFHSEIDCSRFELSEYNREISEQLENIDDDLLF